MTLVEAIDAALADLGGRELVSTAEVVDCLLDLRRAATKRDTRVYNTLQADPRALIARQITAAAS